MTTSPGCDGVNEKAEKDDEAGSDAAVARDDGTGAVRAEGGEEVAAEECGGECGDRGELVGCSMCVSEVVKEERRSRDRNIRAHGRSDGTTTQRRADGTALVARAAGGQRSTSGWERTLRCTTASSSSGACFARLTNGRWTAAAAVIAVWREM